MGQKMGELKNLIDTKIGSQTNQDIEITDASKGIIMKSPSGKRYRITINDEGELTKEELTE